MSEASNPVRLTVRRTDQNVKQIDWCVDLIGVVQKRLETMPGFADLATESHDIAANLRAFKRDLMLQRDVVILDQVIDAFEVRQEDESAS